MVVEIEDERFSRELKNRFIGYEDNGKYYVDDYQAAYLHEIGRLNVSEVYERVKDDPVYKVFRHLRKSIHMVNYTPDGFLLVHEKGMIPKHAQSKYAVYVVQRKLDWEQIKCMMEKARKARKVFVLAEVEGDNIRFFKVSESKL